MKPTAFISTPMAVSHPHFVMVKGYHMGSYWLAEAFSKAPGCALYFEYEHCLRRGMPTCCPSPNLTLGYLQRGCSCSTARRHVGSDSCSGCSEYPLEGGCRATGVQLGALGPVYITHIRQMQVQSPSLQIVFLARSNLVKHAVSFLRTSCGGTNHLTAAAHAKHHSGEWISIPPPQLLHNIRTNSHAQQQVAEHARALAGGEPAYTLIYESAQRDLVGEISNLLRAIGARPLPVGWNGVAGVIIKAGGDTLTTALSNYAELEEALRPASCLHRMLTAAGPVGFGLDECKEDLAAIPTKLAMQLQMGSQVAISSRVLNASQCAGGAPRGGTV